MTQLRRLQHTRVISSMFHVTMLNNSAIDCQQEVQTDIQHLLEEFEGIFAEPTSLPSHR